MAGRSNQRLRTRKALLEAAGRLVSQGGKPSLDDIAAEALVSRATAYRHFPNADTLLLEASLDMAAPEEQDVLGKGAPIDITERVKRVDTAFHDMVVGNETLMRMFLSNALVQGINGGEGDGPVRQNRRSPLIQAALEPGRDKFSPKQRKLLERALGILVGGEAILICQDVLQLSDAETREVKHWAIQALVGAALKSSV
jgi:AcrR family transcriptional regulator